MHHAFEQEPGRRFRGGHGGPRGHGGRRHGGHGGPGGQPPRGFGGRGGWQQSDLPPADDAAAWLGARLPEGWFTGTPSVSVDREEIVVVGELPAPDGDGASAAEGRIARFREESRDERVRIAEEAEARYGRKLAWGAAIGDTTVLFMHLAVPVMTRLRHEERRVLDTLVDSGVARSRSDALQWCVRLVGEHTDEWLGSLRAAMAAVDEVRAAGPNLEK